MAVCWSYLYHYHQHYHSVSEWLHVSSAKQKRNKKHNDRPAAQVLHNEVRSFIPSVVRSFVHSYINRISMKFFFFCLQNTNKERKSGSQVWNCYEWCEMQIFISTNGFAFFLLFSLFFVSLSILFISVIYWFLTNSFFFSGWCPVAQHSSSQ